MFQTRFATAKDRNGINKITKEFSDHKYSHSSQYFDDAITTQKIFVALDNKEIIGYIIYHVIWGNTPYIELLRVTSQYQRKGVGSQLLSKLENKIKTDGYNSIVSSSEKVNAVGNSFHKKQGFLNIGELNMIYGKEVFYLKRL